MLRSRDTFQPVSYDLKLQLMTWKRFRQVATTNPFAALWAVPSLAVLRPSVGGLGRHVALKARVGCEIKVAVLALLYHHGVLSSCVKAPPTDQSTISKNEVISRVRLCHMLQGELRLSKHSRRCI